VGEMGDFSFHDEQRSWRPNEFCYRDPLIEDDDSAPSPLSQLTILFPRY